MVLRRLVAAGSAIVEILFLQERPARRSAAHIIRVAIAKTRLAQYLARPAIRFSHLPSLASFHLPIPGSGRSL